MQQASIGPKSVARAKVGVGMGVGFPRKKVGPVEKSDVTI